MSFENLKKIIVKDEFTYKLTKLVDKYSEDDEGNYITDYFLYNTTHGYDEVISLSPTSSIVLAVGDKYWIPLEGEGEGWTVKLDSFLEVVIPPVDDWKLYFCAGVMSATSKHNGTSQPLFDTTTSQLQKNFCEEFVGSSIHKTLINKGNVGVIRLMHDHIAEIGLEFDMLNVLLNENSKKRARRFLEKFKV